MTIEDKGAQGTAPDQSPHVSDQDAASDDKPQFMTADEFNKAFSAMTARERKKMLEEVSGQVADQLKGVMTALEELKTAKEADKGKLSEADKEKQAMEMRLKASEAQIAELKAANERAESHALAAKRKSSIHEAFRLADGDDAAFELAFDYLDKRVDGDIDSLQMNVLINGESCPLPLKDAMRTWLEKDGARFAKPTGSGGSGTTPKVDGQGSKSNPNDVFKRMALGT